MLPLPAPLLPAPLPDPRLRQAVVWMCLDWRNDIRAGQLTTTMQSPWARPVDAQEPRA